MCQCLRSCLVLRILGVTIDIIVLTGLHWQHGKKNSKHSTSRTERNVKENMEEVSYFNGEPSLTAITEVQYQRYSK